MASDKNESSKSLPLLGGGQEGVGEARQLAAAETPPRPSPKRGGGITPAKLIATWFGLGIAAPWAKGTFGSLAALPLAWLVTYYFGQTALLLVSWIIFAVGVVATNYYIREVKREDPREAVIDEVAGQCFLLSVMPLTFKAYLIGFLLFRFFDILKPFPINIMDRRIHGGFGAMIDDMAAAAYPILIIIALIAAGVTDLNAIYAWLL